MNVVMIGRGTLYSSPGGDTVQIVSTAAHLRERGVGVDIKLTHERIDYNRYDLLHFFNIIRPADILAHIKRTDKKFVVSTIFVDYEEYEKKVRMGILGKINHFLPADAIEYLKALARMVKNGEKLNSMEYILFGHKKAVRKIIRNASILMPNSISEYDRLKSKYKSEQRYIVVPNAIDIKKFEYNAREKDTFKNSILCVARIEGIKNQLNLIRALKNTGLKLFIVGKPSPNSGKYYQACRKEAANNMYFIDHLPQEDLASVYKSARVHALPSWFETTGLSSLEAAAMGCNIVITRKGDQEEYFKEHAFYCEPDDIGSIKEAVLRAYESSYDPRVREYIVQHFTWGKAAKKTLEVYNSVL